MKVRVPKYKIPVIHFRVRLTVSTLKLAVSSLPNTLSPWDSYVIVWVLADLPHLIVCTVMTFCCSGVKSPHYNFRHEVMLLINPPLLFN